MLPNPCLMLVTDRHQCKGGLSHVVKQAVRGGVHAVQLREKGLPASELEDLGASIKNAIGGAALFLVNDRADVAVALGADGVHLPENGLPIEDARILLRMPKLVGRSVHSLDAAIEAATAGADYLIFGNVYETASHPGALAAGIPLLAEVVKAVDVPVLAIGGIIPVRVPEVMGTGAAGVAVISYILSARDPARAAADLLRALKSAQ